MIEITIEPHCVRANGHAKDDAGCAAVSAILYVLVGALENLGYPTQWRMGSGCAEIPIPNSPDAPQKPSFDELIKGEYKKDFNDRVSKIVGRRLKAAEAERDATRPIMALLQQRYDIADGDGMYVAVQRALESDNDYWQSAADKAGMTAEPKLVHEQFRQKRNIPQGRGKTIEFRKFSQLPKALTPLTEGVTPDGGSLTVTSDTAAVSQYGYCIAVSDILDMTAIDPILRETVQALGAQAGHTLDTVVREILNAGTNVQYAEGQVTSRDDWFDHK